MSRAAAPNPQANAAEQDRTELLIIDDDNVHRRIIKRFAAALGFDIAMRFMVVVLLLGSSICCSRADEATPLQKRGKALAMRLCAGCHAIGRTDQSPHLGAPALRTLDRSVDIDMFMMRLREGVTSGHPDMLTFRFSRQDARAFVVYLRSIQAP